MHCITADLRLQHTGSEDSRQTMKNGSPTPLQYDDAHWMQMALALADQAATQGEVPVGALIVHENQVVASSFNCKESCQDPLGHAEIFAIQRAAKALNRWRLSGCTLYVTLEPCTMCAGAIIHARLERVVYATRDPKAGAVESLYQILADPRLNHAPQVTSGVLEQAAADQLKAFFRKLRAR